MEPSPPIGFICMHGDPMVLRDLNGRKVYVCSRWPHHHCSKWCPADSSLLPQPRTPPAPAAEPDHVQPSPCCCRLEDSAAGDGAHAAAGASSSAAQWHATGADSPAQPGSPEAPAEEEEEEAGITPHHRARSPRLPAAPAKSARSASLARSSRMLLHSSSSSAARSLGPLFNGCAPAAMRAQQLGARYMMLRPEARAMASMYGLVSGSTAPSLRPTAQPAASSAGPADSATEGAGAALAATGSAGGRKRARSLTANDLQRSTRQAVGRKQAQEDVPAAPAAAGWPVLGSRRGWPTGPEQLQQQPEQQQQMQAPEKGGSPKSTTRAARFYR